MHVRLVAALSGALILAGAVPGSADDYYYEGQQNQTAAAPRQNWWSGDWYLKLGAKGFIAPRYEGAKDYLLRAAPVISLGRAGSIETRNPQTAMDAIAEHINNARNLALKV